MKKGASLRTSLGSGAIAVQKAIAQSTKPGLPTRITPAMRVAVVSKIFTQFMKDVLDSLSDWRICCYQDDIKKPASCKAIQTVGTDAVVFESRRLE